MTPAYVEQAAGSWLWRQLRALPRILIGRRAGRLVVPAWHDCGAGAGVLLGRTGRQRASTRAKGPLPLRGRGGGSTDDELMTHITRK